MAYYVLGWDAQASWLCGVALSTTSMAVVYAVMLETGFNKTEFGKGILASCFINDLGTVIALGLLFAPFTYKTCSSSRAVSRPGVTACTTADDSTLCLSDGGDPDEVDHADTVRIGCAGLVVGQRSRISGVYRGHGAGGQCGEGCPLDSPAADVTVGFLTPFYFIRAGTLVSSRRYSRLPSSFSSLLTGKVVSKIFGLYPVIGLFRHEPK